MSERLAIKVQSRDEGRVIITKIGHLISGASNTIMDIAFVLNPDVDLMDVAKLLEVPKSVVTVSSSEPVTPGNSPAGDDTFGRENDAAPTARPKSAIGSFTACPGTTYADPLACNLATQIAWLEGFSVVSECTGTFHCEIVDHNNANSRIIYNPTRRPAIWAMLLQKYRVDCSWCVQGVDCEFKIYGKNKEGSYTILADSQLSDFGYCIGSAIVQVILKAERARK